MSPKCLETSSVSPIQSFERNHRLVPSLRYMINPIASPRSANSSLSCLDHAKVDRLPSSCMWSSGEQTKHDNSTSGRTACELSNPPSDSPCHNSAHSCTDHTAAWRLLPQPRPSPCRISRSWTCSEPPGTQLISSPYPDTHPLDPHDTS